MCPGQSLYKAQRSNFNYVRKQSHANTKITIQAAGVNKSNHCTIKTKWKEKTTKYCTIRIGEDSYNVTADFAGGNESLASVIVSGGSDVIPTKMKKTKKGLCECLQFDSDGKCKL